MAAALLSLHLDEANVPAMVRSCGYLDEGVRVSPHSVTVMAERGLHIGAHRSRTTKREYTAGADLILTMAKENVRQVLQTDMEAWSRTFPLKALARRALEIGPRATDEPFAAWIARLHEGRQPVEMLADDPADDIADPMGKSVREYRTTAELIDGLLDQLVAYAFPAGASRLINP